MADRIEHYINNDDYSTVFIMAGTGHFIGKNSIIELLKQRGHKIKRIKRSISFLIKVRGILPETANL